ncbi:MAG TPA: YihY/virulence factor BrkB family protein [Chthoniobacteraceae bacterium]|jgi:YihY family inner membrane protein
MNLAYRLRTRAAPWLTRKLRKAGGVIWRALIKYDETDGEQRAASFAYYAFFAIFPLVVLLISVFTKFLGNRDVATMRITSAVADYMPIDQALSRLITETIQGVVQSRGSAGIIAFAVLAWSALRFFQALVHGVNRAWGTKEYSWWRLPIKNFFMTGILASALLLGILIPAVLNHIEHLYWKHSWQVGLDFLWFKDLFRILQFLVAPVVLFYGFVMFYKFAPRRRTTFREVWIAALHVTLGLHLLKHGFVLYTTNIGNFNALYGTLGSIVALLMWIYLSGSLIILGGCISAAHYEIKMQLTDQSESNHAR